jgi:RHH-type proline utilization regulon transcriptional repressor/proline dehydrogenase/delta 1-pyrroline-5-carboxylate dehydrogenase
MNSPAESAIALADRLLRDSLAQRTRGETRVARQIARMIADPPGKSFTLALADQIFRARSPVRAARRLADLERGFGIPAYLSFLDRALLRAAVAAARCLPWLVMPLIARQLRLESAHVILPGEPAALRRFLSARRAAGARVNLNHLGEAVLGEAEAAGRLEANLKHLSNPMIDCLSVKASSIFSQVNVVAWDRTLSILKERLRRLYRAAVAGKKLVNLDMEEYRDLALTLAAFREVLDEDEFLGFRAGIALQAYLPDSWDAQREITAWARRRVSRGGAPVRIRLVKGANLAMETIEAEMRGWSPAPYATKAETDANFKRMLEFGCLPDNARAVNLGVASHNLFDVALALVLREQSGIRDCVEIEMLEGMANHQARAVQAEADGLLVYAPVVKREDFISALAYLVRRLDENTAPENFLRDLFGITPGSPEWKRQLDGFLHAWELRKSVGATSRRAALPARRADAFSNEPDTDWTQARHRDALHAAIAKWKPGEPPAPGELNPVIQAAVDAGAAWNDAGPQRRADILMRCADVMTAGRLDAIACMREDAAKAVPEADTEVSEAVDFARYYARAFDIPPGVNSAPLGVVVVAPPWNFPYAIPAGGVFAALMAGNTVILKPAPETVRTAWLLAQQLWESGVPREVLQFFACPDGGTGRALLSDARVGAVILTGAYDTARMFQQWRPSLRLHAETSGKNAVVITAMADADLAIKDLVRSAFGHAGQKCSAASLGILEAEVYDDPRFHRQLRDAAASLPVGPATELSSVVTPLIRAPGDALHRALTSLEPGEEWLLEPRCLGIDERLWSPGIKLGVQPGSWFHQTECFGPVLGLMRARDLDHAIEMQNAVPYGLTAGLHSLDEKEIEQWRERVEAGNAYVNRAITGAIVQRQPFGGWKRSSIGPGAKAGGPNYVHSLCRFSDSGAAAAADYEKWWMDYFSREHDPSALRAESNVTRYRPCHGVILRLEKPDAASIQRANLAATTCNVRLFTSIATEESDRDFIHRLPSLAPEAEFLRTVTTPSDAILLAAYEAGLNWINAPLLTSGRLELPRWLREQSISETRHRYGQLLPARRR